MEIYASHLIPDEQFKSRKGTYVSDDDYDILLTRDCDVYDSASKKVISKISGRQNIWSRIKRVEV